MMTPPLARTLVLPVFCLALISGLSLVADEAVAARPPRSERVAARAAERVYARQAIAEARALRAEAQAAEMAKIVPVPPPPRRSTIRRMARAGVLPPVPGQPQAVIVENVPPVTGSIQREQQVSPAVVTREPAKVPAPRATASMPNARTPQATTSAPKVSEPAAGVWTLDPDPAGSATLESDGTRSVLATGGEAPATPDAAPGDAKRSGPAVTQPPIELLPTPPAQ